MKLSVLVFLATVASACAQDMAIDTQRSTITVHVGKTGLLSAAAHEHWVNAPVSSGMLRVSPDPHVEFTVEAAKMKVKPDAAIDAKTQATIQEHMEDLVLETKKYPEIAFKSTKADKISEGQWKVEGNLSLHGVTKPVSLTVKRAGDGFSTHTVLKQTDFGIQPITVAGGIIKVKNEVDLDFQIFARQP